MNVAWMLVGALALLMWVMQGVMVFGRRQRRRAARLAVIIPATSYTSAPSTYYPFGWSSPVTFSYCSYFAIGYAGYTDSGAPRLGSPDASGLIPMVNYERGHDDH